MLRCARDTSAYEQQRPVIDLAAAELPLVDHADGVLLDLLGLHARHDQHGELRALGGFKGSQFLLERPLLLGGVQIPHELGASGHSDADVLAHAVIDALLGASGLGDIGEHFPDTDERLSGADSMGLLGEVVAMLEARGFALVNVDCTVLLEQPKLGPNRSAIRSSLAHALGLDPERVNVKASTGEGIGFVGRGEGVAALAVASVERAS